MLCGTSGGVRGDGCWESRAQSEESGDNLGFLGLCHGAPPGMMARAEGTCCEDGWRIPAQGREGNVSAVPLASLMSPLYPSYKGCNTQVGLYNSTRTHTQTKTSRCRHIQTPTCMNKHLNAYSTHIHTLCCKFPLSLCDPWWRSRGVVGSSTLTFRIVCVGEREAI